MSAQQSDRQTRDTALAFDDWAGHWSTHYDVGGVMAGRIARFAGVLEDLDDDAAVLDYGCGTGEIARAIAGKGWRLSGCDLSSEMLAKARAADADQTISWFPIDPAKPLPLPFEDATFAAVYSSSVFEYLSDPQAVLRDIHRVLKPGGRVVFTVPDLRHPIRRKEAVKSRLANFAPFWALIKHTRWKSEYRYLRISVTRPPLEGWHDMLKAAGFEVAAACACDDPLAMLVARKLDAA